MPDISRILSLFPLTLCALSAASLACTDHCDKSQCPLQTLNCSPGRSTVDVCACCPVCLQGLNQTCGGLYLQLGRCEAGLDCVLPFGEVHNGSTTELGVCQEKNCSKEACVTNKLELERGPCPEDSYQIIDKARNQHQGCECLPSSCPTVKCPEGTHPKVFRNGSKIPGSCCTQFACLTETELVCRSEGKVYVTGESWKTDVCTKCSCDKGLIFCKTTSCDFSKKCGYMMVPEGECCPVCNGCVSALGKFYKNGVLWKEDDCTTCQCQDGIISCQAEMCQTSCHNPSTLPGYCCPVCLDVNSVEAQASKTSLVQDPALSLGFCQGDNHKKYGHGEMWFDGCRHCYCNSDREMCSLLTCPVLHCPHPKMVPGNCCPVCSKKSLTRDHPSGRTACQAVDGHYHVEGETWSLDPCTWCLCLQGQVLCEATQCPPTPCPHPTHHLGSCCSTCYNLAQSASAAGGSSTLAPSVCYGEEAATVFVEGQKWHTNPCQSCICLKGEKQCFQESCPPVDDCSHPVLVKHRCCPVCLGSKSSHRLVCHQDGRAYRDGERWTVNDCTSCICMKGMQMCTEKICSSWCPRPLPIAGQCCPICQGESVDEKPLPADTQQHLSLAMVIICAAIMVLLSFVVVFLVLVVLRQRKVANKGGAGGRQGCQRPKSTNLELQGMSPCSKPLLDSVELKRLQEQGSPVRKNIV